MAYGVLSGLLIDTVSGFILGPHIISKSIAGFLIGVLKEHLFQWNILINTIVIGIFSVFNILIVGLLLETFSRVSFANRSLKISILEIIFTIIASLLIYPVLKSVKDS